MYSANGKRANAACLHGSANRCLAAKKEMPNSTCRSMKVILDGWGEFPLHSRADCVGAFDVGLQASDAVPCDASVTIDEAFGIVGLAKHGIAQCNVPKPESETSAASVAIALRPKTIAITYDLPCVFCLVSRVASSAINVHAIGFFIVISLS
jgi:hypothetical protein